MSNPIMTRPVQHSIIVYFLDGDSTRLNIFNDEDFHKITDIFYHELCGENESRIIKLDMGSSVHIFVKDKITHIQGV